MDLVFDLDFRFGFWNGFLIRILHVGFWILDLDFGFGFWFWILGLGFWISDLGDNWGNGR